MFSRGSFFRSCWQFVPTNQRMTNTSCRLAKNWGWYMVFSWRGGAKNCQECNVYCPSPLQMNEYTKRLKRNFIWILVTIYSSHFFNTNYQPMFIKFWINWFSVLYFAFSVLYKSIFAVHFSWIVVFFLHFKYFSDKSCWCSSCCFKDPFNHLLCILVLYDEYAFIW